MRQALIAFAGRLRRTGVQVSPAEIMDAALAFEHTPLGDRAVFKDSLRSLLIKRGRDIPVFDDLFDLFFTAGPGSEGEGLQSENAPDQDASAALTEMIESFDPDLPWWLNW